MYYTSARREPTVKIKMYIYRMIGLILAYSISYVTRPKRIIRTIKSLFSDSSSTIVEQRLKDYLRRSEKFKNHIKPFVIKYFFKKHVH